MRAGWTPALAGALSSRSVAATDRLRWLFAYARTRYTRTRATRAHAQTKNSRRNRRAQGEEVYGTVYDGQEESRRHHEPHLTQRSADVMHTVYHNSCVSSSFIVMLIM